MFQSGVVVGHGHDGGVVLKGLVRFCDAFIFPFIPFSVPRGCRLNGVVGNDGGENAFDDGRELGKFRNGDGDFLFTCLLYEFMNDFLVE